MRRRGRIALVTLSCNLVPIWVLELNDKVSYFQIFKLRSKFQDFKEPLKMIHNGHNLCSTWCALNLFPLIPWIPFIKDQMYTKIEENCAIRKKLKSNWKFFNKIRLFGIDWVETLEKCSLKSEHFPLKWTWNLEIFSQSEKIWKQFTFNKGYNILDIVDNIMVKFWIERSKILASSFSISFGETLFK